MAFSREANQRAAVMRRIRMKASREKGMHTDEQWQEVLAEFGGRCARCWRRAGKLVRDHIVPVYQGGSDDISNMQAICSFCSASKGPESIDWRTIRRTEKSIRMAIRNARAKAKRIGAPRRVELLTQEPAETSATFGPGTLRATRTPAASHESEERR